MSGGGSSSGGSSIEDYEFTGPSSSSSTSNDYDEYDYDEYDYDVCENDESVSDVDGDTCSSYYDQNPDGCGNYDTDEFIAARECCVCGGGSTGYYEDWDYDYDYDYEWDYDYEVCENDESVADVDGDTCSSYYESNPDGCGNYDTEEFIAARECCVCGGGSTGSYSSGEFSWYMYLTNDELDGYAMIWSEDPEFNTLYVWDESGAICTLTTDWIDASDPE
jgi:hypothetical protein